LLELHDAPNQKDRGTIIIIIISSSSSITEVLKVA